MRVCKFLLLTVLLKWPKRCNNNIYFFPYLLKQFGITDWKVMLLRSEEEDQTAHLRRREIEINLAVQMKNLGFEVDMNEEGDFVFKKFPSKELIDVDIDDKGGKLETDPYAGTNIDASQLGQLQEQAPNDGPNKEGSGCRGDAGKKKQAPHERGASQEI